MVLCNKEVKACSWQDKSPLVLNPMTSNCYVTDLDHPRFFFPNSVKIENAVSSKLKKARIKFLISASK